MTLNNFSITIILLLINQTGKNVLHLNQNQKCKSCVFTGIHCKKQILLYLQMQWCTDMLHLFTFNQADSQSLSVVKEVPVQQQEPHGLAVSPQSNNHAAKYESTPREDKSVSPQTHKPNEDESAPTPSVEESWAPPHTIISASHSHSLRETPTETWPEEEMSVDEMGKGTEPDTEESPSTNKLCEEEKAEVKSNEQPGLNINRSEITELAASSLEGKIEPCESKTPDQVLLPPTVAAHGEERDIVEEETEHTSLIQEMNVGFPPTAAPESLQMGDLKIQQECSSLTVQESTEVQNRSVMQSPNSDFISKESEKKSDFKEDLMSASEKDSEVHSCIDQKVQELTASDIKSSEERNENLQLEVETEMRNSVKVEKFDESKSISVIQNNESNTNIIEELKNVAHRDSSETKQGWPLENIPQIQISTIEDTLNIKPTMPDVYPNECYVIPKIETMEPELKECTLPLTILALNKQESEPDFLKNHDATHVSAVIIQDHSMPDSPSLLPTRKKIQDDHNLPPTEKVKEVAQLNDKSEIFERDQPCVKSNERLPQMAPQDFVSVPVISVSCTDDKEDNVHVNTHVSDTQLSFETPTVPLIVVPSIPVAVTCDYALQLSTQNESSVLETSAARQRGTKHDVGNNMTAQSRKQNVEETAEKSINENTPSLLYKALIPKVGDSVLPFSKTTEDNVLPEVKKTKAPTDSKIESSVSVEDLQRNRSNVERLCSKPPTHPSLSPASLRKFMSKAASDSDNESVTTVPAITVGDRQSDKADDDLSGGSTPTSSLSCESSPRLKRRDSLSLIRSATPEELASGARRKIFIPKPKEDGEGALVGVHDVQGKKETPYMSPSQARRAALLQANTGQNTPPMEKRSPLLSRRKVTLEVPKVVEETPTEEPLSPKREEKPAEKKLDPLKGKESTI